MKSAELAKEAGISYRQLDYWQRKGFIGGRNPGKGRDRDWTPYEVEQVLMMADLVHAGLSPANAANASFGLMTVRRWKLATGLWIVQEDDALWPSTANAGSGSSVSRTPCGTSAPAAARTRPT